MTLTPEHRSFNQLHTCWGKFLRIWSLRRIKDRHQNTARKNCYQFTFL